MSSSVLEAKHLNVFFGNTQALFDISLKAEDRKVLALIGPSGCGKSTFLRALNRLHDETPGARVEGEVWLGQDNIYGPGVDPVMVRRRVGMVFQKPNPFPTQSIYENVVAGLTLSGIKKKSLLESVCEESLKHAALWDEVKDKLNQPAISLSGGQQQRLCIARALTVKPEILLMDEPTSALDPISTAKIEELIESLKKEVTIIIVTHNMQQAGRISDQTAFFLLGKLIEHGETSRLFTTPKHPQTERYITGRFG